MDGVAVFERHRRTGALRQLPGAEGCVTEAGAEGCAVGRGLAVVRALALDSDGRHLYAAARSGDAVAVFERSPRSGALRQLPGAAGCISQDARAGCAVGRALDGGRGIVLSPDQRFAYVAAEDGDSVAVFARNRGSGRLSQLPGRAGCLQRLGSDGCAPLATLRSPHDLVLSRDGRFAYAASDTIGAVVVLRRNGRTGTLTGLPGRRGCIGSPGGAACRPARAIRGAHSLALSPGGRVLYAVGRNDHAVAVLTRNPSTGVLGQPAGQSGCIGRTHVSSCTPARGLRGAHSVAADGRDVYVASELDDAVASLATRRR